MTCSPFVALLYPHSRNFSYLPNNPLSTRCTFPLKNLQNLPPSESHLESKIGVCHYIILPPSGNYIVFFYSASFPLGMHNSNLRCSLHYLNEFSSISVYLNTRKMYHAILGVLDLMSSDHEWIIGTSTLAYHGDMMNGMKMEQTS